MNSKSGAPPFNSKELYSRDLKQRLYEKGVGHSLSAAKSPFSVDLSNHILLTNLGSTHHSKVSPKSKHLLGKLELRDRKKHYVEDEVKKDEKSFWKEKNVEKRMFGSGYSNLKREFVKQEKKQSPLEIEEFRRTKVLMEKLSGKAKKRSQNKPLQRLQREDSINHTQIGSPFNDEKKSLPKSNPFLNLSPKKQKFHDEINVENYIRRALKDTPNLEEFLYLVNKKYIKGNQYDGEEDPYDLAMIKYNEKKKIQQKYANKYYTISKKGFCFYVNGKPADFIELDDWVEEKKNYKKIKNLNFFNRFRKWKTIKMWRKVVLKHRIEECSKNLEEKLFFLNSIMRKCLFEVQQINIKMGKSLIIISRNHGNYSLDNFKLLQEKTKRETLSIIEDFSKTSRVHVKNCFDENIKQLRSTIKEKEQLDEKPNQQPTYLNAKDSAFQELGFPSKMTYENRSKLRKMAGSFIRFSYLVDMIYSAGLASSFQNQLGGFVEKLNILQYTQKVEVLMGREETKAIQEDEMEKMFNVKLQLQKREIKSYQIKQVEFKATDEREEFFYPLYHIQQEGESLPGKRKYVENICELMLTIHPNFDKIYEEISSHLKDGLKSLKNFQRWSKHGEMQRYINILEQWDDVVSQSRSIADDENLDPLTIVKNFEPALSALKEITAQSLRKIKEKIKEELTEYLNIHWQHSQLEIKKFQNQNLCSPAETIQSFLRYMSYKMHEFEKKIPYKMRLGIFEINLQSVKGELIQKMESIYEEFKGMLPGIIIQRTEDLNSWLKKYRRVMKEEVKNIDDFIRTIRYMKEIDSQFESKKEQCQNLSHTYQTMEKYKFDTKKRKEFQTITLKLKDELQQQINIFQQTYDRKSELYSREVLKIHLPNLIKDISKLTENISHPKYLCFGEPTKPQQILKDIKNCEEKYADLEKKKQLCLEYKQVLNLLYTEVEELDELRKEISARNILWNEYSTWDEKIRQLNEVEINKIDLEETTKFIEGGISVLKNLHKILPENEVLQALIEKVQILQKNIPIIVGIRGNILDYHWEEINEITSKISSINLKQRDNLLFKDFVQSAIGKEHEAFQQIFHQASEQAILQREYEMLEKKWEATFIRVRLDVKYHLIVDKQEQKETLDLFNETLRSITTILSSVYSAKIKISLITHQSVLYGYDLFTRWINIQDRLMKFEKICKAIDVKKLSEFGMLENAEKGYKVIMKYLLGRNVESSFKITKLAIPSNIIDDKLHQCEESLTILEDNIRQLFHENCKFFPLFYQFTDEQLLTIFTDTNTSSSISFIIQRLLPITKRLEFDSERISKIITKDNENLLKTPISTTGEIEQIIEQVIEAVGDTCRRMMRSCRLKSLQSSLIDMIEEYNIQFLLAIGKVDFSQYTAISIENNQENSNSLKDYWKILRKDTHEGIIKLKAKSYKKRATFYNYETILLQNLVHQQILIKLVNKNIICCNEYDWIKELRFVWEDNGLDETNISVRKMQISIRYGQEYIGSDSKVVIDSEYDILTAMKYSQICTYLGYETSLKEFMQGIGHKLVVFKCENNQSIGQIKNMLLSHSSTSDSCFLFKNTNRLNEQVYKQLLSKETLMAREKNLKKTNRQECQAGFYCPILLQTSHCVLEQVTQIRQKYRNITFSTPSTPIIQSYLSLLGIESEFMSTFLKKIFFIIQEFEGCQGSEVHLGEFLNIIKVRRPPSTSHLISQLMEYIKRLSQDNEELATEVIANSYPNEFNEYRSKMNDEVKISADSSKNLIEIEELENKIVLLNGKQSSINSYLLHFQNKIQIQLNAYEEEELYGNPSRYGLFQHIIHNIPQKMNQTKVSYFQREEAEKDNVGKVLVIHGLDNRLIQYLSEYKQKENKSKIIVCMEGENTDLHENGTEALALSRLIDPKMLLNFKLINLSISSSFIDEYVEQWIKKTFIHEEKSKGEVEQSEKQIREFVDEYEKVKKFYYSYLKHGLNLWFPHDTLFNKYSKVRTFVSILEIMLPTNNIKEAMVYAMIWALKETISSDYIKLQIMVKKILGEENLIENVSLFDYMFVHDVQSTPTEQNKAALFCEQSKPKQDKLLPISSYIKQNYSKDRTLNRGEYFLTETIVHYQFLCERIYRQSQKQIHLFGPENSGKSVFMQVFKEKITQNTVFLTINMPNKSVLKMWQKIKSVVTMYDFNTLRSKLNYSNSFVMVEDMDLGMDGAADNKKVISYLKMIIKNNKFFDKKEWKHYKVEKVDFMLCSRKNIEGLNDCTIKIPFSNDIEIQSIFIEILKANLLDPSEVSDDLLEKLMKGAFKIYIHLSKLQTINSKSQKPKLLSIEMLKTMTMNVSHLRYKETMDLNTELERFWTAMLCENFIISQNKEEKKSFKQLLQSNGFNSEENALYSHLHIKQQKYGHGKEVEYVKDIKRIYNIINEKIEKYNESEGQTKRYGHSFEFISIDEIIIKIIKVSNHVLHRDYSLYGRKGSDCKSIIRLTAYLLGYNYQQIKENEKLTDFVRGIIPDITKVSSFLIYMKVNEQNYQHFIDFYDLDFGTQIVNAVARTMGNIKSIESSFSPKLFTSNNLLKNSEGMMHKLLKSNGLVNEGSKITKVSSQEILKIRKSIRLMFEFNREAHLVNLPKSVKSQLTFDYLEEFPQESVVKFSHEILQLSQLSASPQAIQIILQIYQYSRKSLAISLKEYEDCIRLYSSFVMSLPAQLKSKIKKLSQIICLYARLKDLMLKLSKTTEQIWEQKKSLALKIQSRKEELRSRKEEENQTNEYEDEVANLEEQLGVVNENLQGKIQLKCQCEKIIGYLEETVQKYREKRKKLEKYSLDGNYLQQRLAVVASYFTYLSKLKHEVRRSYLQEWEKNIERLRELQTEEIKQVSQIFNISREEQMVNIISEENEEYYDNMTIILQSIKPIIIKDDGFRGRKWLKEFDESFVTIEETNQDFYEKLSQYLSSGHNILLELKKEETFNTLQTNYINSLIYMSENTPTVEVNGEQIAVSKESKVYIVIDHKINIPECIENEFLLVTYEQHYSQKCKVLQHDLLNRLHSDKYNGHMELKRKITDLSNDCEKIEIAVVEALWSHFYGDQNRDEEEGEQEKQKSEEEFIEQVWNFRKGISDRIQALMDKIKLKKKVKKEVEDKLTWQPITGEITLFTKNLASIYEVLEAFERKLFYTAPSPNQFYEILKSGIQSGFVDNVFTLIIFSLKQWGKTFNQKDFLIFSFLLLTFSYGHTLHQTTKFIQHFEAGTQIQFDNSFFGELAELTSSEENVISEEIIEEYLIGKLITLSSSIAYENLIPLQMNERYPLVKTKKVYKLSNIEHASPMMIVLTGLNDPLSLPEVKTYLKSDSIIELKNSDNFQIQFKKTLLVEKCSIFLSQNQALIERMLSFLLRDLNVDENIPEDIKIYIYHGQVRKVAEMVDKIIGRKCKLLNILNVNNRLNLVESFFKKKCPFLLETPHPSNKQSQEVTQKNISAEERIKSKKTLNQSFKSCQVLQTDLQRESQILKVIVNFVETYLLTEFYDFYTQNEEQRNFSSIYSQNWSKNMFQISQPLAIENGTWNIYKTFTTIIKSIKNIFSLNEKISPFNKKEIQNYLEAIEDILDQLDEESEENKEEMNEEENLENALQKIQFNVRAFSDEEETVLKQKWLKRQSIIREGEVLLFKNGWLRRLKEVLEGEVKETKETSLKKFRVKEIWGMLESGKRQKRTSNQYERGKKHKRTNNQDRNSQKLKNICSSYLKIDEIQENKTDRNFQLKQASHQSYCQKYFRNYLLNVDFIVQLLSSQQEKTLTAETEKSLNQFVNGKLQKDGQVPLSWQIVLAPFLHGSKELNTVINNLHQWKQVVSTHQQQLQNNFLTVYDAEVLPNPVLFISQYLKVDLCRYCKSQYAYYIIQNASNQQINTFNALKIKMGFAKGWRLNNEGTLQIINDDKLHMLKQFYIAKRLPPSQLTSYEVRVTDRDSKDDDESDCFELKVYVNCKKGQGFWKGELFFKKQ